MATKKLYGVQVLFQNEALYAAAGGDRIAAMKAHIDAAAALGVEVIRFPGDWRALQPDNDHSFSSWYLKEVTETLAYAKSLGLSVVMTFAQTPYWATGGTADPNSQAAIWSPPTGAAADAYANALVAFHNEIEAAGLRDTVIGWEVWNEPNTTTFWPTAGLRPGTDVQAGLASAAEYVHLLNTAYDALHAVDPNAVVLGGSLAACDADYLTAMYDLGARFDALALHPYTKADPFHGGVAYGPTETSSQDALSQVWSFAAGVQHMRDVMVAHGDAATGMWFTEFGWSSTNAWGGAGSEAAQATFLTEALQLIKGWDFVDGAIAYRLFDGQGEEFGMRHADGSLKAAGMALRDFMAGITGAPAAAIDGLETDLTTHTAAFTHATSAIAIDLDHINTVMTALGGSQLVNLQGSGYGDTLTGNGAANAIDGASGNDTIDGGAGNDVIRGGAGDNWLHGGAGADTITGGEARDWIEGGAGADSMVGGGYHGHLIYWNSPAGVTVNLATGAASGGDAAGDRFTGMIAVDGSAFADRLTGSSGDNWVVGREGNDILNGLAGNDRVDGGAGADSLVGGLGIDTLIGGAGADTFDFNAAAETAPTAAARDTVMDFAHLFDHIDLATIDANSRVAGDQAFKWIGATVFHKLAGELHYVRAADGAVVEGDTNGDGRADFQILVKAASTLAASDFYL